MASLRMIGTTDDVTVCDCCGKKNLKRVVVLTDSDSPFPAEDEVNFYGSQCAVNKLRQAGIKGFKKELTNTQITKMAKEAETKLKYEQQDHLIENKEVVLIGGYYLLPDFNIDQENWLKAEVDRRNVKYPCFA